MERRELTPEERELLTGLFDRLKQADVGGRDADAERTIATAMAAQPSAAYYMAQLLLVQDQALSAAQVRIRQLEEAPSSAPPSPGAPPSFLDGARARSGGPWGAPGARPAVQPRPIAPDAGSRSGWASDDASGQQPGRPSGTGGFLRGAMQTAAGVAGGALLFEGINSLFHHVGGPWGSGFFSSGGNAPVVEETIIENFGERPEVGAAAFDPASFDPTSRDADPSLTGPDATDATYDDDSGPLDDDTGDLI